MNKIDKKITQIMQNNYIMCAFFLIIGILISVIYRYEILSDFNNYHYYLPWAFFHNRTFENIAVAMENSYHNPLIEIPAYFIVNKFNDTPVILHIYQSIYWGLLLFVFYRLCFLIFGTKTIKSKTQIILSVILASTGFAFLTQNGTSSNEIPVSLCVLTGLYLLYREIFVLKTERTKIFFIAGFIVGGALGLKLTIITYCISLGLTLLLFWKQLKTPIRTISFFALGGFCGFMLTYGWWGVILYKEFNNPIFPYLNNIFKSDFYSEEFLSYSSFYEKRPIDYLIFPFLASFQKDVRITAEPYMLDARWALGYILLIIYTIGALCCKKFISNIKKYPQIAFLVIFSIISYLIWLKMFAIIRYAVPFEMLISVFIVLSFFKIIPKSLVGVSIYASSGIILLFVLFSGLPYTSWGNRLGSEKIIESEKIKLPENSMIIAISPNVGLAITQILEDNPNVKIANETSSFTIPGRALHKKITEYKESSDYIAYILALKTQKYKFDNKTPVSAIKNDNLPEVFSNLQFIIKSELGVENFYCQSIMNNFGYNHIFLCIDKKDKNSIFTKE